ncbi:MAG: aminotransferase class I/II-fold pyridoxal phosphate-dependent enzyme [Rhodothermales bacterium]|nr:aminotransferase class I/II-fold pyridoxal phosphate-dependent enzyme [Rhodothermales bacterium]
MIPNGTTMRNGASDGGENFSLRDILLEGRKLSFSERTAFFSEWINDRAACGESLYLRNVLSAADREVTIYDRYAQAPRRMLMFGSNNYLGLTAHPYVRERVRRAVDEFGTGVGGPPLLNGYSRLHAELEERLAAFKGKEAALILSSGYGTNVGLLSCLTSRNDTVVHDAYCHASFHDGLKMGTAAGVKFAHNDVDDLERLLEANAGRGGDTFVGVEGVYSMDGDTAPLDRIAPLCKRHGALLLVDDAHGTGVLGPGARGTAEHYGVDHLVDLAMGTFSKAFGVSGGFVAADRAVIDYLRFFCRSYFFSASMPPMVAAAVLGCLEVLEAEPEIQQRLLDNVAYCAAGLRRLGFDCNPESPILTLILPETVNLRKGAYHFHRRGIFLNSIEYPAVPAHLQRFRISMMATHTREDIDRLLEVVEEVWDRYVVPHGLDVRVHRDA